MAPNPDRQKLRQINERLQIRREDLGRLQEELKTLRAERDALRTKLASETVVPPAA